MYIITCSYTVLVHQNQQQQDGKLATFTDEGLSASRADFVLKSLLQVQNWSRTSYWEAIAYDLSPSAAWTSRRGDLGELLEPEIRRLSHHQHFVQASSSPEYYRRDEDEALTTAGGDAWARCSVFRSITLPVKAWKEKHQQCEWPERPVQTHGFTEPRSWPFLMHVQMNAYVLANLHEEKTVRCLISEA